MKINKQLVPTLALLAGTLFPLGLACTSNNARFCESAVDCGPGQACAGGLCESTRDAPDAGSAPSIDAALTTGGCDDGAHTCVSDAPSGWSGPAIQVEQEPGVIAVCPTAFDGGQVIGFEGLTASGSCSCSCGDTTDFTCQDGGLEGRNGPIDFQTCFADCAAGDCVQQSLNTGICTTISSSVRSEDLLRLNEGRVTGGSCGAGTIGDNLEEPRFDAQVTLCVAALSSETCQEGSSCVVAPPPPFDEDMCIFQAGEHDCPEDSIYSQRRVIFADYDDQRSCDTCSCEPKDIGGSCGSVEVFHDDPNCLGAPINTNGICLEMPTLVTPRAKFTRRASLGCRATVDPPISGDVVSIGATTLCCAR